MSNLITANQLRELWNDPNEAASIDRGEDYTPVTKDDLGGLMSSSGVDANDVGDDGEPAEHMWQILAEALNSNEPGEPNSTSGHTVLGDIADARIRRDQSQKEADMHDEAFRDLICTAVKNKQAPVTAIAAAADFSRERIYQIRDGRR